MRKARKRSKSGYYHIMIRGVNGQNIFYDTSDYQFYKKLMKKLGKRYKIKYHAYALMGNHTHMLIEDKDKNISRFMQVLCSVYARYFNRKYDRTGHLFGDRFVSEVIENNRYLAACCRYIVQNPQKAGICNSSKCKWSSYNCYKSKNHDLINTEVIRQLFTSIKSLYIFLNTYNNDIFIEPELKYSERERLKIEKILSITKTNSPLLDPSLPEKTLKEKIRLMRKEGLSIRTIERITGIGRYKIQKVS